MDEITRLRPRDRVSRPSGCRRCRKYVGDRSLAVMMNTGVRSRRDFEQTAPDRRRDAERRCDRGATFEPGVCAVS